MKRYNFDDDDYPVLPHSGLGIASFLITLAMGLLVFVLFIIAGILETSSENGIDENSPTAMLLGSAIVGGLMIDVLGMGLGIGGLCQPKRNKLFAGLGLGFGAVVFFGAAGLMVIGAIM